MDRNIEFIWIPSGNDWDCYTKKLGFKSKWRFLFGVFVVSVLFCLFLAYLLLSEPSENYITARYQRMAPYMVWLFPPVGGVGQYFDIKRVSKKRARDKQFIENLNRKSKFR